MGSDLKYQTDEYLINQLSYLRRQQNKYEMRAKAVLDELNKRRPAADSVSGPEPLKVWNEQEKRYDAVLEPIGEIR